MGVHLAPLIVDLLEELPLRRQLLHHVAAAEDRHQVQPELLYLSQGRGGEGLGCVG